MIKDFDIIRKSRKRKRSLKMKTDEINEDRKS